MLAAVRISPLRRRVGVEPCSSTGAHYLHLAAAVAYILDSWSLESAIFHAFTAVTGSPAALAVGSAATPIFAVLPPYTLKVKGWDMISFT